MTKKVTPPISVVMIEDDPALCEGWKDLFEMLGHKIACFPKGMSLLSHPEAIKDCDLMITDYYLPDLNGVELVKKIRVWAPELPAIVLTGSRESFIREAVDEVPNCQILYKPLNIDDIESRLNKLFGV